MTTDPDEGVAAKRQKLNTSGLYKTPTAAELSELRETELLYHSALLRLQIEELLKELSVPEPVNEQLQKAIELLRSILQDAPAIPRKPLMKQKWLKKSKIVAPMLQQPVESKGHFAFEPPVDIKLYGAGETGFTINVPPVVFDAAVIMPKSVLERKDYLNQRWLRKRMLYLCRVADCLRESDAVKRVRFHRLDNEPLKPVALVQLKGFEGFEVRLNVVPEDGSFKADRFQPNKSNVRSQWFNESEDTSDDEKLTGTPEYNALVVTDVLLLHHWSEIDTAFVSFPQEIPQALQLLTLWLRRRHMDSTAGGVSELALCQLILHLHNRRKLTSSMNCYQVFRCVLLALKESDWLLESPCVSTTDLSSQLSEYRSAYYVTFLNSTGSYNFCWNWTEDFYFRLRHEASLGISLLESTEYDCMDSLFVTSVDFFKAFDTVIHIDSYQSLVQRAVQDSPELAGRSADRTGLVSRDVWRRVLDVLRRGLGSRVSMICRSLPPSVQPWDVDSPPPAATPDRLSFGFNLTSESLNAVLKGPHPQDPAAAGFRQFWGDWSELRRFPDSTICEAVYLKCSTHMARRLLWRPIVTHLLQRHCWLANSPIHYTAHQLEPVLMTSKLSEPEKLQKHQCAERQFSTLSSDFDQIAKILRDLKELELQVVSVQPADPALRFTDTFPHRPVPTHEKIDPFQPTPLLNKSIGVVLTLEGSGAWPEDVEAVLHLKAAFLIKMMSLIQKKHSLRALARSDHLLIVSPLGNVYRVMLYIPRELQMLKASLNEQGVKAIRDNEYSTKLQRQMLDKPKISSAILSLQRESYCYSVVTRLAKRWLSSQLLLRAWTEEAVELLVAAVFIHPAPFVTPRSSWVGFHRFLDLLASHDWQHSPLVVNFNQELPKAAISQMWNEFEEKRTSLPPVVICTPHDPEGAHWTKNGPTLPILRRCVLLARKASNVLTELASTPGSSDRYKTLFRPRLEPYDVVIQLNRQASATRHQSLVDPLSRDQSYGTRKSAGRTALPPTDFDPVVFYLQQLEALYGEAAYFFYDVYGGDIIAVLWKPEYFKPVPPKVMNQCGRQPVSQENHQLVPNLPALLADFVTLGKGLVLNVETRPDKWKFPAYDITN